MPVMRGLDAAKSTNPSLYTRQRIYRNIRIQYLYTKSRTRPGRSQLNDIKESVREKATPPCISLRWQARQRVLETQPLRPDR